MTKQMWLRKLVTLALVSVAVCMAGEGRAVPGWSSDYQSALAQAQRDGRPVVIDFGSPTCPACRMLERRTLSDPQVQTHLDEFVRVYIDGNEEVDLRQSYGVQYYPTLVYLSPEGKVLKRHVGFVTPEEMSGALREVASRVGPRREPTRTVADAPRNAATPAPARDSHNGQAVRPKGNFYEMVAASGTKQNAGTGERKVTVVAAVQDGQPAHTELVRNGDVPSRAARGGGDERLVAQALPVPKNVETPAPLVNITPQTTPAATPTPAPTKAAAEKSALPESVRKLQSAPAATKAATVKLAPKATPEAGAEEAAATPRATAKAVKSASGATESKSTPRTAAAKKAKGEETAKRPSEGTGAQKQSAKAEATPGVTAEDIDKWFADAESKLMAGYKKEARAMYAKIVERDPSNKFGKSDVAFIKMVALMVDREDDGLRRAAHTKITEFLKRFPDSPNKDYYTVVRAILAADLGDYAEAHALLDRFPEEFPESRYQDLARSVWQELPKDAKSLQKRPASATASRSATGSSAAAKAASTSTRKSASSSAATKSQSSGASTKKSSSAGSSSKSSSSQSTARKSTSSGSSRSGQSGKSSSSAKSSSRDTSSDDSSAN
jgi:thiol-disulfide isomerase/thioredoxin/tetratricopeptide (TPR) repeat protein